MTYQPAVGEFFVTRTGGLAGAGIRAMTRSTVNHAGIHIGGGQTLEAKPVAPWVGHVRDYPHAVWAGQHNPALVPTPEQGKRILAAALLHTKDTYSWVDCAALGLTCAAHDAGLDVQQVIPQRVLDRLADPHRNFCSQLVDRVSHEGGLYLFNDGRAFGAVSPGDLLDLAMAVHRFSGRQ